MRILFHHRVASRDGQAVHIEEMIAALRAQGHETVLVGPPSFAGRDFGGTSRMVDLIKGAIPGALYELLELAYNIKAFLRLRAAVRAHRPDVIYERFSLFLLAGIWVRRLSGIPLLMEVNSPLFEERSRNDGLRLNRLARWAQRLLWTSADHVLPVTGVLARTIAEYGVPQAAITVIPNGINPTLFGAVPEASVAKAELGLPPRLVLGFTGFIRGWNAVHHLIDFVVANRHRFDLHILVVGDGPARESLIEHARVNGVSDRLTIAGVVPREQVARHVAAFDIAVVPALTPYSSPLKLFEYLQLGRAIVAPDTENLREVLTDGQDAILFDPTREGALGDALLRLCEDAGLRARLGQAGPQTILAKSLTWSSNAGRVAAIAESLIRARRGCRPVNKS
jgi:glycosyltransferase involved in cell wall biosynthesis